MYGSLNFRLIIPAFLPAMRLGPATLSGRRLEASAFPDSLTETNGQACPIRGLGPLRRRVLSKQSGKGRQGGAEFGGNPVNDPLPVARILDQARIAENAKLMGNARLGHLEDECQLADAKVALEKKADDPESRPVGQSLEHAERLEHERLTSSIII